LPGTADRFEQCLANIVTTDFTGLWGGQPEHATASDLRTAWATLFAGFRVTQAPGQRLRDH